MNTPFYYFFLMMPYIAWAYVYFTKNLLQPKKWLRFHYRALYIITLFFFLIISVLKTRSETLGVNLMQIYVILTTFICFEDSIGKKISGYLFFEILGVAVEAVATSLYMTIRSFIPLPKIHAIDLSKQNGTFDIIGISLFVIVIGVIFYMKEVKLLKQCFAYLNVWIFFQLLVPLLIPILAQGLIINQISNPNFPMLASVYWILCLICYPLFLFGVRSLRKQGKKRHFQEQQLLIMKEQLAFSKQSEEEYAALRKWNHDSENHLLAMSYLMDMGKFEEAAKYRNNLA